MFRVLQLQIIEANCGRCSARPRPKAFVSNSPLVLLLMQLFDFMTTEPDNLYRHFRNSFRALMSLISAFASSTSAPS